MAGDVAATLGDTLFEAKKNAYLCGKMRSNFCLQKKLRRELGPQGVRNIIRLEFDNGNSSSKPIDLLREMRLCEYAA